MSKVELLKAAQQTLKDCRHGATVSKDEQIQSGVELAQAVLSFFNTQETLCHHNCHDCRAAAKAKGEDSLYDDGI